MRELTGRAVRSLLGARRYNRVVAAAHALKVGEPSASDIAALRDATDRFHLVSYTRGALNDTYWFGVPIQKLPLDLWVYQELCVQLRPDVIVETGTYLGGSALFFAHVCDLLGAGRVITIDLQDRARIDHARVTKLLGGSTDASVLRRVRAEVEGAGTTLVVLDSDHSRDHVLAELRAYAPLVTVGSYLVVEDTNVNGHPVMPEHGAGPHEAVEEFLRGDPAFVRDRTREKFLLTYFPGGWLRRVR